MVLKVQSYKIDSISEIKRYNVLHGIDRVTRYRWKVRERDVPMSKSQNIGTHGAVLIPKKKRGSAEQVLVYKKVLAFDFSSQLKNPLIHSIMEHIDRNQLYTDSEYRFGYVSKFMDFGK